MHLSPVGATSHKIEEEEEEEEELFMAIVEWRFCYFSF